MKGKKAVSEIRNQKGRTKGDGGDYILPLPHIHDIHEQYRYEEINRSCHAAYDHKAGDLKEPALF